MAVHWTHCFSWIKSGPLPVFVNKVLLTRGCAHSFTCSCLQTTATELSSCKRDSVNHKAENIYRNILWPFYRKHLATPGLGPCLLTILPSSLLDSKCILGVETSEHFGSNWKENQHPKEVLRRCPRKADFSSPLCFLEIWLNMSTSGGIFSAPGEGRGA